MPSPSIWRTVAQRELLDARRDGRHRVIVAALLLLSLSAALGAYQVHHTARHARDTAARTEAAAWLSQGRHNPHNAAHLGRFLYKPVEPLSLFDRGLDSQIGALQRIEAHRQTHPRERPAEDAGILGRFGEVTPAIVLQQFVPFLVVVALFSTFAAERERGTLAHVASTGVPIRTLALGKAAGAAWSLLAPLAALAGIGSLALLMASGADGTGPELALRVVLLASGYFAYFMNYVVISLAVSAVSRTSGVALTVLLIIWASSVVIVPRIAATVAESLYPVPQMSALLAAIAADKASGLEGHDDSGQRAQTLLNETLERYGVNRVEDLPIDFDGVRLQADEEYSDRVVDKHYAALWRQYARQEHVRSAFFLLSPVIAVQSWSRALSDTGMEAHRDYWQQAESFRRTLVRFLNHNLTQHGTYGDWTYRAAPTLWSQAPQFTWRKPPLRVIIRSQTWSLLLLAVTTSLAVLALRWALWRVGPTA
jgi:ABC-2 type transport system permease protein